MRKIKASMILKISKRLINDNDNQLIRIIILI